MFDFLRKQIKLLIYPILPPVLSYESLKFFFSTLRKMQL